MKYKLKRDLPFAKAGKEVSEDDASFYIEAEVGIIWCFAEIKDRHKLISEGWIEEVKPREWYEIEFDNSKEWIKAFNTYRYDTLEEAQVRLKRVACRNDMPYRIIKVQEVIQ